eukprot:CAMPEP_0114615736 /NCGR_PEP_ID=MMETSP0168-20121206/6320_1 /TAXON_ID=95228 ORGANISM="Vannella sp., Strain DIVA3 517/6/12" /NCGR_SAMPLE_ID=MMETSP0168 /ASSEMBLY_ACC=CAM_ASM_000044 /LENGTH=177 /DNA_ID=CAMNT_0001826819 /DNA_START=25 /DNA_END=558 /DNA_ORIENTATION=-
MAGTLVGVWLMVCFAALLLEAMPKAEAAHPCEFCVYCDFCSLCEECPCDHAKECEYCEYCRYCPLCNLCSSACAEDSLINSALSWFGSWQDQAMSLMGVDTDELPDWDELEQVAKEAAPKARTAVTSQKITTLKRLVKELADLDFDDFYAVVNAVHHKRPEWWDKAQEEAQRATDEL